MSSFTTPLEFRYDDENAERSFVVDENFVYWTMSWPMTSAQSNKLLTRGKGGECIISVKRGYATDFASIPRILWNIFPPYHPHYTKAAVVHDFLYSYAIGDKTWADLIFLEAMTILGCPPWKRKLFYLAVKYGGRGSYG